ncbi:mitochondrial carrier domain-containing protein [Mycotypha africana]|uniref:mitochondrial carrier domain-containing protein n=1 Tax=Mycotypha africana TaxID=64632 RepID=UPI002300C9E9|nr:mitochondrial carrier domain-containing protein [Mycotypha africana]KAI8973514.1 mitochondrial carrier domain-containing protein [Mycotypha africana]
MSTKNYSKNYISQEQDDHSTATKQKTLLQKNRTILAASGAAWTSVLAGFPFDSIKTRMQTHYYSSIMSCVRKTYAEEGTRGFFRGMIPPLVTVSIIKSVSFSVYEETKKNLLSAPKSNFRYDTLGSVMTVSSLSGGVSGAFIALLSCPLELVKIQRQLELVMLREMQHNINQSTTSVTTSTAIDQRQQASSWKAVKKIVQRKGIFGLWNGLACHSGKTKNSVPAGILVTEIGRTNYVVQFAIQ